ncbi:murein hydrolase activator EnvC family protein [Bordetella genomosp. 13]|uniref:Peptidase n=1 Tax=Bordetella genomosp. 13 TaxID=463040 RepID=A0A1W6ZHT5_9BORD|nr:peptidoglycan DD-metalloendopeptidase family protein [Bordetella genomosp. 13]ARP96862.1 peptidase [Bordetella genomosp. 13]
MQRARVGPRWARRAAVLALGLAAAGPGAAADLAGRQSEAEREQAALRERIDSLQKEIDAREAARKEAADALKASESAISRINLRLRDLAQAQHRAEIELASLEKQMAAQRKVLEQRRAELSEQLRAQYASGLSPWTALLSGDDPQQLGRNLGYLDYVSRARARSVAELRTEIDRLAALQAATDARRTEIANVVDETAKQKAELVAQQKERATLVAQLEGQIAAQRAEAGKLGRDDQRLSRLIGDLEVAIERQAAEEARRRAEAERKAEEARKEAARKAELARKAEEARRAELARKEEEARKEAARQAEAVRQARTDAERRKAEEARAEAAAEAARVREQAEAAARKAQQSQNALVDPDSAGLRPLEGQGHARLVENDRPSDRPAAAQAPEGQTAARPERESSERAERTERPEREASARSAAGVGNGLRRGLPPPVRGATQGRFGVDRPDGGVWRGIVLRAAEGTPVKAVAPGRVVYAEWLRGFGNLIIVDHGQQYMSVYAYNQSLLKRVGDAVAAGDTIATVGATGGQVESGLYFEIRHRGAPVDPAQWLAL